MQGSQSPNKHLRPAVDAGGWFRCAMCEKPMQTERTHAEAMQLFRRHFPREAAADDPRLVVCEQCYEASTVPLQEDIPR